MKPGIGTMRGTFFSLTGIQRQKENLEVRNSIFNSFRLESAVKDIADLIVCVLEVRMGSGPILLCRWIGSLDLTSG